MTTDFDANDNEASATDSVDSSVPDTQMVNSNPGWSKYRHTYVQERCTMTLQQIVQLVQKLQHWPTITNVLKKWMTRWILQHRSWYRRRV